MTPRMLLGVIGLVLLLSACGVEPNLSPSPAASQRASTGLPEPRADASYPAGTVGAFLARDGRFSTFLALMESDDFLLRRLQARPESVFTLFVPSNEAFELLDAHTRASLSTDPVLVTGIVERHFMPRRLPASEFATAFVFTGMSRRASRLALVVDGGRVHFGDGIVVEVDLVAGANGIVHIIDAVNLGPTPERRPIP